MAYELKQRGYTDVTILERSNRVGGKAETFFYRNTEHSLSVVYWTREYENTLIPLLEKYGFDEFIDPTPFAFWPFNNDTLPYIDPSLATTTEQLVAMLTALNKYVDLHHDLFGIYNYDYGVRILKLLLYFLDFQTFVFS